MSSIASQIETRWYNPVIFNPMKRVLISSFLLCAFVALWGQPKKPTIMVVPSDVWCVQNNFTTTYENQGVCEIIPDYVKALQTDANLLLAIAKINTASDALITLAIKFHITPLLLAVSSFPNNHFFNYATLFIRTKTYVFVFIYHFQN